jgi:hypothetical protein
MQNKTTVAMELAGENGIKTVYDPRRSRSDFGGNSGRGRKTFRGGAVV